MKEIFKKSFSRETLEPFFIGVGTILLLEFVIFPGLTVANTLLNLFSAILTIGLIIFTITYLKSKIKLWDFTKVTKNESVEINENETNEKNKNESIDN